MSHEASLILDFICPGDLLIVVKLDRLGRNTRDVLNLVHELEEKGASLRVLEPAIDTGGPMGRMVLTALGMVAEMELGFLRDRQRAGIDAAKAKGVYKGRLVTFDRARIDRYVRHTVVRAARSSSTHWTIATRGGPSSTTSNAAEKEGLRAEAVHRGRTRLNYGDEKGRQP